MALSLSDRQFQLTTESLGELQIDTLRAGVIDKIRTRLRKAPDEPPEDFARFLVGLLASSEPERGLAEADLSLITTDELDSFARSFVETNEWLLQETSTQQDDTESNRIQVVREPIDLPRESGESNVAYMRRVIASYLERMSARLKKMIEPFTRDALGLTRFSKSTAQQLLDQLEAADSVRLSNLVKATDSYLGPPIETFTIPPHPGLESNRRLEDMGRLLAAIEERTSDSARSTAAVFEIVVGAAGDWAKSSRRVQRLTLIMMGIGLATLIVTAVATVVAVNAYLERPGATLAENQIDDSAAADDRGALPQIPGPVVAEKAAERQPPSKGAHSAPTRDP